jgi:hypothetical protein
VTPALVTALRLANICAPLATSKFLMTKSHYFVLFFLSYYCLSFGLCLAALRLLSTMTFSPQYFTDVSLLWIFSVVLPSFNLLLTFVCAFCIFKLLFCCTHIQRRALIIQPMD